MSSRKSVTQNRKTSIPTMIQMCRECLQNREFIAVRFLDLMNLRKERLEQFEQARAISDVLQAAENPLPDGSMDYYGMMRMTGPKPIDMEDFNKLMKILERRANTFPFKHEAAEKALLAFSKLSKPQFKAQYDRYISTINYNRETQGNDDDSQSDDVILVDGGFGFVYSECVFYEDVSNSGGSGGLDSSNLHDESDTSIIPKKDNVGPGVDDEVVIISDDDDVDDDKNNDDDEGQEMITMARTAKLCKINGKRVKVIPLKKKQNCKRV